MQPNERSAPELIALGQHLKTARLGKGLTQAALAERCGVQRQQITYFERGTRLPSLEQLLQLGRALDVPLQRILSGTNSPGAELKELALELRELGLIDLWIDQPLVPGTFRRPEEVLTLAVARAEPEARVVEALPALLAWNRWSPPLLRAYGKTSKPRAVYRLAWLADVALAIDRVRGFPGGCPGRDDLAAFVKGVKPPPAGKWDGLGKPLSTTPTSPVWKRWGIDYAADLATFRGRAEQLLRLRQVRSRGASVGRS